MLVDYAVVNARWESHFNKTGLVNNSTFTHTFYHFEQDTFPLQSRPNSTSERHGEGKHHARLSTVLFRPTLPRGGNLPFTHLCIRAKLDSSIVSID